jgi:hypothetical protein
MSNGLRGPLTPVIALALAGVACGPQGGAETATPVHRTAPTSVTQALAEGRPARAIVLLDDAPAQAAAAQLAALRTDPHMAAALGDPQDAAAAVLEETKVSLLAASSTQEVEVLHRYARLPALHVELRSPEALERLLARGEVARVVEDEPHEAFLAQSLPLLHQPTAAAAGATGQGTAVAVLDTGVDYTRADFGGCSAPGVPAGCRVAYAHDFAPDDHALDAHGHGTNVAAIVAGVAPGTKILALDVFNGQYAYTSDILAAIDWVIQNRARYGIVALNLSLGSGGSPTPCASDAFASAIHVARLAGVLATVASGNDGKADRIASPACTPDAVSVGAVYDSSLGGISYSSCSDFATAPDQVTCFSNSASFLTVLAPGALITAGGITMAGTSQAAPHVAGAIAVWKSVLPDATPDQLVARLRAGPMITDPRNGVRTPRVDLAPAAAAVCAADLSAPAAPLGGEGGSVTVAVTTGAGCAWSVSAPPTWLGLSTRSGKGPATFTVSAVANTGATRSAVLSAGGKTATITQGTDRTAPAATLAISGGAAYTRSLAVTLAISASDPSGLAAMCISNGSSCSAWRPWAAAVSWTLAAGSGGTRTVYLRVKDGAGNVATLSRSILFDVSAPAGGRLGAVAGAGAVSLSWPGYGDASGVARYTLVGSATALPVSCAVGTPLYSGTATAFLHRGLPAGTRYSYRLCATDGAGNTSAGSTAVVTAR